MSNSAQTTAGTKFGVTSAAPANRDLAGFSALTYNYGDQCEVTSIGTIGSSWSTVEDESLCTGVKTKQKASQSSEPISISLYLVKSDTMQQILQAAYDNKVGLVSVQILYPNGSDSIYFQAQVTKFNRIFGSSDEFIKLDIDLEYQHLPIEN